MKAETVGFSDITYDEALRRAQALIPFLREQAPKCEALRRLTPEVMDALNRAGLFRYLQPKMWGGMELPFVAYFDIPEMLSRGDISVGWVVANLGSHHRNLVWWSSAAGPSVAQARAGEALVLFGPVTHVYGEVDVRRAGDRQPEQWNGRRQRKWKRCSGWTNTRYESGV